MIDSTSATIEAICRSIESAVENQGIKAAYIDYVQLLSSDKKTNRSTEVAYCSQRLKETAMKLGIWILNLAQYNRLAMYNGEAENHSFADSGQIEKDASIVLHLSLEKIPDGLPIPKWRKASIRVGKARNAPPQTIEMVFRGETFMFADVIPYEN